jgi:hypothetical protein
MITAPQPVAICKAAFPGYHSAKLVATGLSCARATAAARVVARELHGSGSISVPGVSGFSVSTTTCTGCGTTTQVTLLYASGAKVTLSLRSGSGKASPPPSTGGGGNPITV